MTRTGHATERVADGVYVGRAYGRFAESPFHNPFHLRKGATPAERRRCVERFAEYFRERPDLIAALPELRGKTLLCWCRRTTEPRTEHNLCHTDVLRRWLATYTDEELEQMAAYMDEVAWEREIHAYSPPRGFHDAQEDAAIEDFVDLMNR